MEGAAGDVVLTAFFQRDLAVNKLNDIGAGDYLIDECFRDSAFHINLCGLLVIGGLE